MVVVVVAVANRRVLANSLMEMTRDGGNREIEEELKIQHSKETKKIEAKTVNITLRISPHIYLCKEVRVSLSLCRSIQLERRPRNTF